MTANLPAALASAFAAQLPPGSIVRRALRTAGDFSSTVAGIPCRIEIVTFSSGSPGRTWGAPEYCYEADPGECEFEVLDRNGRAAPWLARKMTSADESRIYDEIIGYYEDMGAP